MKQLIITLSTTIILTGFSYSGFAADPIEKGSPNQGNTSIAFPLLQNFSPNLAREEYIAGVLRVIRENAEDRITLTQADAERQKKLHREEAVTRQVTQLVAFDTNHDGFITREEISERLERNYGRQRSIRPDSLELSSLIDGQIQSQMKYDRNGDGKISYAEMAILDEKEKSNQYEGRRFNLSDYLVFDANKDGKLTIDELETAARNAFAQVDANGDSIVSNQELAPLEQIKKNSTFARSGCVQSDVPKDAKIVFIDTYEAQTLSNIALTGQDEVVKSGKVIVQKSSKPVYLVLSSMNPSIWEIEGSKDQVKGVLLAGRKNSSGQIMSGATGVSSKIVRYLDRNTCMPRSGSDNSSSDVAKMQMLPLMGRAADLAGYQYAFQNVIVEESSIKFISANKGEDAPRGFDPVLWQQGARYNPGGVVSLDPGKVVSEIKAEKIEVLPGYPGLAKLVAEGALVPVGHSTQYQVKTSSEGIDTIIIPGKGNDIIQGLTPRNLKRVDVPNAFKIVKYIPTLPKGALGNGITPFKFVLGKGVKPPKLDMNTRCLISEETKRPVFKECSQ